MYLPYVFVLRPHEVLGESGAQMVRRFLDIALLCALAGIAQFYLQFVWRPDWLFDYTARVPVFLHGPANYNTVIPMGATMKSNGFFFREPSGFSFIMALALIAEGATTKRARRLLCYGVALLLTYSGTGLLALFLGMSFPLGRKTIVRWLILAVGGGLAFALLGDTLNLSFTLARVSEFGSESSSGYIRYIAPLRLIRDTIGTDAWTLFIGHGPGTITRQVQSYEFHDPTWAKLLFEYGVLGFLMFLALFLVALRRPNVPIQIRATLFFAWLVMGGHLLSPELNFLTLAMVGLLPVTPSAQSGAVAGREVATDEQGLLTSSREDHAPRD